VLPFGLYELYSKWFIVCSFIFKYISYPLMILLYCCLLFTYFIGAKVLKYCQQYATIFTMDTLVKTLGNVCIFLFKKLILKKGSDPPIMVCIICFKETALVKLFPCLHEIMCENCAIRIARNDNSCPVCRQTIRFRRKKVNILHELHVWTLRIIYLLYCIIIFEEKTED
jgi:hypothetical protein